MRGCHTPKQGFIAMACEIEYCLENNKVTNDDTESQKNQPCFQTYGTDV